MLPGNIFNGRKVVVTGASRGLGRATAVAFARQGADVAILARSADGLRRTAAEVNAASRDLLVLPTDLSDQQSVAASAQEIDRRWGHIDVLVHNAAGWLTGPLEHLDPSAVREMIAGTLVGAIWLTQALLPALSAADHPRVINIASTAALPGPDPEGSSVAFIAAKRGLVGFGEALGAELRPKGIAVTNLYPGGFHSESPLDMPWDAVAREFGSAAMAVADVVDAIFFCASRSPLAAVQSMVLVPSGA